MSASDRDSRLALSFDGKTIRSTEQMDSYDKPPRIVSAQLAEPGITPGQQTANGKSNGIPAARVSVGPDIEGCTAVADALNCQKETAKAVIEGNGD